MTSKLRRELIKLAYNKKHLRPYLFPILKKSSRDGEEFLGILEESGIETGRLDAASVAALMQRPFGESVLEGFEAEPSRYLMRIKKTDEDITRDEYHSTGISGGFSVKFEAQFVVPWEDVVESLYFALTSSSGLALKEKPGAERHLKQQRDLQKLLPRMFQRPVQETSTDIDVLSALGRKAEQLMSSDMVEDAQEGEVHQMDAKWISGGLEVKWKGEITGW